MNPIYVFRISNNKVWGATCFGMLQFTKRGK